jgi:hypothetical protein
MTMHLRSQLAILVAALLLGGSARADFTFEFANASTGQMGSAFSVAENQTISINVYFLQTNGPVTNSTNLTQNGLLTGGVGLQYQNSAPFSVPNTAAIVGNPAFSNSNPGLTNNGTTTTASLQVAGGPVFASTSGPTANAVLLGTFTFTAGSTAGSANTVTVFADTSGGANFVDGAGTNLDALVNQSSVNISVVAVPEPGSLMLTGLAASALGLGIWKRRRKALTAQIA